jgi:hypothetical protein
VGHGPALQLIAPVSHRGRRDRHSCQDPDEQGWPGQSRLTVETAAGRSHFPLSCDGKATTAVPSPGTLHTVGAPMSKTSAGMKV